MALSIAIIGLPNVGKSTLFNALTNNQVLAANYPFATIEPNTGVVPLPDERLDQLQKLYPSAKKIPAQVTFVDVAGLVAGASHGEGLGNQFLAHIRSCNAMVQVVRAFDNPNVQHVDNKHDPKKDIETINTELALADLQTIDIRLPAIEKEAKADPKLKPLLETLKKVKQTLDQGKALFRTDANLEHLVDLQLLSSKPLIYVFNVDEKGLSSSSKKKELAKLVEPVPSLYISAKLEDELKDLDETDAQELLNSYGQSQSGLVQLIKASYKTLGLQSFLTAGDKEVRAWTIKQGMSAPQAAGVIHTDFEHGFIAADVVNYDDLITAGSWPNARAAGKVRTEGKTYTMQPDDVVEFKFNVS